MKLHKVGALAVVGILAFAACSSPGASTAPSAVDDPLGTVTIPAGEPLHIAYWGVLSGADASLGEDSRQGVEIAIDDLGGTFKGHDIRLTTEDGLCTLEGGATAGQKLAADSTLVGLIGSLCSVETVGGIKSITEAGLTTISPSNTLAALTATDRDATYAGYARTARDNEIEGKAAAQFVYNELKLTKAATIHDGSVYAEALQQVFADEFTKLGGTITVQEAVSKGQTDMQSVLTAVAATSPELIYFPVFIAEAGSLRSQISQVPGLETVKTMSAPAGFSVDFLKAAGATAVGHYLSGQDFTAFTTGYQKFLDARTAKFGGDPLNVYHAHAYDATNILFAALDKVAVENADGSLSIPKGALRAAIFATKDFKGLTGTLSCTPTGDCGASMIAVYEITKANVDSLKLPSVPIWKP